VSKDATLDYALAASMCVAGYAASDRDVSGGWSAIDELLRFHM
jgi:hypothetical protein